MALKLFNDSGVAKLQAKDGEESITATADGDVKLYYDNAEKLATTSAGVNVTGEIKAVDSTVDLRMKPLASNTGIVGTFSNHGLVFNSNSTERMRINSDGRIGIAVPALGAVQMAMQINGQSWFAVWEDDAGNDKFLVASSGNVFNANNSYGAISDIKLKENVVDTSDKLDDLKKVQVKNYNFIGDSQKQIGVIAQELEAVFPSMVEESPDLDEDGNDLGTVTKSVKYSVFVPILIKSLQEQQTIIEDLETRIQALEAGV